MDPIDNQQEALKNGSKNNERQVQVYRNRRVVKQQPKSALRQWFIDGFESKRFHKTLLAFILLEWIIVSSELLIDIYMTGLKMNHKMSNTSTHDAMQQDEKIERIDLHLIKDILQYSSFTIQTIFLIEVIIKVLVFRGEFFRKRHEMFDSLVVITSFILSFIFIRHKYLHYTEAIVILRVWNTLRLIHGLLEAEHENEVIDEAEEMEIQHHKEEAHNDQANIKSTSV